LQYIASKSHGFSGADLGFITQRAVKIAIKEAITADINRVKEREAAGDDMDVDDESDDPVPELTKRHFEEAMQMARRSVSDVELRRYEAFAQQMKNAGPGAFFKFPTGGVDGGASAGGNNDFGTAGDDDGLYD
jgi:transitional endoplasmic reticulum ATPase